MDAQKPSVTISLAEFATTLFGEEWAADVARVARVNLRTVQRVQADAKSGVENRSAEGVLRALKEALVSGLVQADGLAEYRKIPINDVAEARKVVGRYGESWEAATSGSHAGPFDAVKFWQMVSQGQMIEQSLYDLLNAAIDFYNKPNHRAFGERLEDAIFEAVETVDALVAISPETEIIRVRAPRPFVFGSGGFEVDTVEWPTDRGLKGVFFTADNPWDEPEAGDLLIDRPIKIGSVVGFLIDDEPLPVIQEGEAIPSFSTPITFKEKWLAFVREADLETVKKQYETADMKVVVDELEHQ